MVAPVLSIDDSQETTLTEHVNTLTLAHADPRAAPIAPKFEALIKDLNEVTAIRVNLVIALATAEAKASYLDVQLDEFVDELVSFLVKVTKRNRKDPLWKVYFAGKEPHRFKSPILQGQLAAMAVWPASLASSSYDELKALEPKLTPVLKLAESAEKDVAAAKQSLVDFRNVGRWFQHIAKSNAERQAAFGFLAEIAHKQPELKLGSGYADLFFLHDTSRRGAGALRSSKEIGSEIEELEGKLAKLKKDHTDALEREKADSDADAEEAATLAALAVAEKKEADAKAERELLEKKASSISKAKGKGKKR